jgi:hypothetical protein
MTPEQLATIQRRLQAASPGPWNVEEQSGGFHVRMTQEAANQTPRRRAWLIAVAALGCVSRTGAPDEGLANAELIAHAPEDLATLCASVEQAWSEIARLRGLLSAVAAAHVNAQDAARAYHDLARWEQERGNSPEETARSHWASVLEQRLDDLARQIVPQARPSLPASHSPLRHLELDL